MLFQALLTILLINFSLCEEENQNGLQSLEENPFRSNESRIVNGEILDIEEVPYYVSLFKPPQWRHYCGGAIISTKWILSAGHCFYKDDLPSDWKARSGSSRVSRGGVITDVTKIIVHPSYNPATTDNDFALVNLKKTLVKNDRTQIIKLPDSNDNIFEGNEVLISGHGETHNELDSQEILRGIIVKIANFDTCNEAYESKLNVNTMICASTENKQDSCQGDSGGPMESLSDGLLVGVVSFGTGCGDPAFPGVYSKVSSARDWIKTTAKV